MFSMLQSAIVASSSIYEITRSKIRLKGYHVSRSDTFVKVHIECFGGLVVKAFVRYTENLGLIPHTRRQSEAISGLHPTIL